MYQYLSWLSNPFVAGIFAALLITLLAFIDDKMGDKRHTSDTYIKLFICVAVIVTILVYLAKNGTFEQVGGIEYKSGGKRSADVYVNAPDF